MELGEEATPNQRLCDGSTDHLSPALYSHEPCRDSQEGSNVLLARSDNYLARGLRGSPLLCRFLRRLHDEPLDALQRRGPVL
jgi:hypothetical protein